LANPGAFVLALLLAITAGVDLPLLDVAISFAIFGIHSLPRFG
jgi:hypothetical protein